MPERLPLPPYLYEFWADPRIDPRCLYVGKATGGPGLRIKAHFDNREPWALAARWIRVTPLPLGTPDPLVLAVEADRIHELTPRGNKEHNWAHHDAAWAVRVQQQHARAMGVRLPRAEVWRLRRLVALEWVRRLRRVVLVAAVVDGVAVLAWLTILTIW